MHIVIFTTHPLFQRHFATELEIIQDHLNAGDTATVLRCDGELLTCDTNLDHEPGQCWLCQRTQTVGVSLLSQKVPVRSFYNLTPNNVGELRDLRTEFVSVEEMDGYMIEKFDIGRSVLASMISLYRDAKPDLQAQHDLVRRFMLSAFTVYRSVQNFIDQEKPDRFYIFNGRMGIVRAILRACESRGIPYTTHEAGNDDHTYSLFENTAPFEISFMTQVFKQQWEAAQNNPKREEIAAEWYINKSKGAKVNGYSMVDKQQYGLLPADWDESKRNIIIFASSDFEFAAVSEEWRKNVYSSQEKGIRLIAEEFLPFNEQYHLYLRVHPNLRDSPKEYEPLLALQSGELANVLTVIHPTDTVSSYALLHNADKVVSFRSTVGIEATFWGKPAILAGKSEYYNLGATYTPQTHEEVIALLLQDNLPPKDKEGALIYGYFYNSFGESFKYYQANNFFGGTFNGNLPWANQWWFRLFTLYKKAAPKPFRHIITKQYIEQTYRKLFSEEDHHV